MEAWIKQICKFCGRELEGLIPECTCEGWEDAKAVLLAEWEERYAEWEEEQKDDPQEKNKDDPQEENFDTTYPLIYDRKIITNPLSHAVGDCIGLDARKFQDGIGLCIYLPFWNKEEKDWDSSGLCFDFPAEALSALRELLKEADEAITAYNEPEEEDE